MELHTHRLDAEQAVAILGPVAIRVIRSARTEAADIDCLRGLIDGVLASSPAAGMWIVVHHGAPIPDASARRHAGRVLRAYNDRLSISYSMLGLGFWANAARAATMTVARLIGTHAPVEATLEAGAERLSMDLIGIDPAALVEAHDELLAQIQTQVQRGTSVAC